MRKAAAIIIGIVSVTLFAGGVVALLAAQGRDTAGQSAQAQEEAAGSPAAILAPLQVVRTSAGVLYGLSPTRGLLVSLDQGATWLERNQGLSRRVVYPFTEELVRRLTSLGVDPAHEGRVAVTMASEVFLSEDFGVTWVKVPWGKPLRTSCYFTSVALSPHDPNTLVLGTSFSGFYETRNRGASWQDPSLSAARQLNRGAGFYEEVSGLSYDPLEPGVIWFACGFGQGIYRGSANGKGWSRIPFPGDEHGEIIRGLSMLSGEDSWRLEVRTSESTWRRALPEGDWNLLERRPAPLPPDPFLRERQRKAADRLGIYISSFKAQGEDLRRNLKFLHDNGLNALVVDCKDDFGWVTYDTALELPKKIGAVERRFKLEELVSRAHDEGLYVIGRVVVFKDRQLYNYDGFRYAVWNGNTNQPWRHLLRVEEPSASEPADTPLGEAAAPQPRYFQREYWVDPYNSFIWGYNVAIAEELQARGVDEIQFDYIRFPSDGNLGVIRYRCKRDGMDRIDALESFLKVAREKIHIPVSTDLYGYSTWHRMGNWIGQSTDMLADYVDVICPMYYPSHFPRDFMKSEPYLQRAERIYREGTLRAQSTVGERCLIRPYVQAFLIGGELNMGVPQYNQYLLNQVQGCLSARSSGFTLWNASNRYYMVSAGLKKMLSPEARSAASAQPASAPGPASGTEPALEPATQPTPAPGPASGTQPAPAPGPASAPDPAYSGEPSAPALD
jgi:hypothetical protein